MLNSVGGARRAGVLVALIAGFGGAAAAAQQPPASGATREMRVRPGAPIDPAIAKLLEKCGIDAKALSEGKPPQGVGAGTTTLNCNVMPAPNSAPAAKPVEAKPAPLKRL